MFRPFLFTAILTAASPALATVQFQNFLWKADNSIEVQVIHNQVAKSIKGELRDGQTRELTGEGVTATVKSHSNSFVTLAFIEAGQDEGGFVVLERQNSQYVALTRMIYGRASTLIADYNGAIEGLKKVNRWDHSLALRSLASYFETHPLKKLNDFYDAVELGHVRLIAKPTPRVAAKESRRPKIQPAETAIPAEPTPIVKNKVAAEPKPVVKNRTEDPWRTTVERNFDGPRRQRAPLPYEPRYSGPNTQYPGQNMRPRQYAPPPPERRRVRTLFDILSGN